MTFALARSAVSTDGFAMARQYRPENGSSCGGMSSVGNHWKCRAESPSMKCGSIGPPWSITIWM
jgi:hypothetical protein